MRVFAIAVLAAAVVVAMPAMPVQAITEVGGPRPVVEADPLTEPPLQPPPPPPPEATVRPGDTLYALADAWGSDRQAVLDINQLQDPNLIFPGQLLKMPGGTEPPPAPAYTPVQRTTIPPTQGAGRAAYDASRFAPGYCTWYVASRRPVWWPGNAFEWWGNAQAAGAAVGSVPRPGAIMVTRESSLGHVAYVDAVNGDGSWHVWEMNYRGWNVVSERVLRFGTVALVGFIY